MSDFEAVHCGYASPQQNAEYCDRWAGRACWSCNFFDPSEPLTFDKLKLDGECVGTTLKLDGYCRRHAPKADVDDDGEPIAVWPWVQGHEWCGEYKIDHQAKDWMLDSKGLNLDAKID